MSQSTSRRASQLAGGETPRSTEDLTKSMQEEYTAVQKKTFTNWINSHLSLVGERVTDVFQDLRDGNRLITLLQVLSGERLPATEKGTLRIHSMLKVEKALQFLEKKLHLQLRSMNIGAEDVVDGNEKITLGIVWLIILRFQIQMVASVVTPPLSRESSGENLVDATAAAAESVSVAMEGLKLRPDGDATYPSLKTAISSSAPLSPDLSPVGSPTASSNRPPRVTKSTNFRKIKRNLLEWLQNRLISYSQEPYNINIDSFQNEAWKNGLAFAATLHSYRPSLVPDLETIITKTAYAKNTESMRTLWRETLESMFDIAEKHFGITRLLDAEDLVDADKVDEKSLVTYFSNFYIMIKSHEVASAPVPAFRKQMLEDSPVLKRSGSNSKLKIRPASITVDLIRSERVSALEKTFTEEIQSPLTQFAEKLQQLTDELEQEDIHTSSGAQIATNNLKIVLAEVEPAFTEFVQIQLKKWMTEAQELLDLSSPGTAGGTQRNPVKEWVRLVDASKASITTELRDLQETCAHLEQLSSILKSMESRKAFLINIDLELASGSGIRNDSVEATTHGVDAILSDLTLLQTSVNLLKDPYKKAAQTMLEDLKQEHEKIKRKLPALGTHRSPPAKKSDPLRSILITMSEWLNTHTKTLKAVHEKHKKEAGTTNYTEILKHFSEHNVTSDTNRLALLKSEFAEKEDTFKGAKYSASNKEITDMEKEFLQKVEKLFLEMNVLLHLERYRINQARKIYKFHKAAQEVENWLTAAKLAILSVPIDLSKGQESNQEIKGFEEKLVQFEPTIKTLLLMNDKLSMSVDVSSQNAAASPTTPGGPNLLPSPTLTIGGATSEGEMDSLALDKQQLHERYAKVCSNRAKDISELWKALRKTVVDINNGYKKAYKISKMTESFQTVTSTLNGVEKEQNTMEFSKKFDKDRLNMFESSLNDVGVVLDRLQQDLATNKEVEAVVGRDYAKLRTMWDTAKTRNHAMIQRTDSEKKVNAYNQIAEKVEVTVQGLYQTASTSDLQGKSYQSSSEHALMLDSLERKYRAFKPSIEKMLSMLDELIKDLESNKAVKTRHDAIHDQWKFVVEAMAGIIRPSHIPKLRRGDSSSLTSTHSLFGTNVSTSSLTSSAGVRDMHALNLSQPRRPESGSGTWQPRSGASTPISGRRNNTISVQRTGMTPATSGTFSTRQNRSLSASSASVSASKREAPSGNTTFNAGPAQRYTPNPHDPLDVAVAAVVNECPLAIRVVKQDTNVASNGFAQAASSPMVSAGNKYWFGNMDIHGKGAYCRLRGNMVVVRIGGGWQALSDFLLDHGHLEATDGEFGNSIMSMNMSQDVAALSQDFGQQTSGGEQDVLP